MGLNEHQRGHETPKTLFNALRLSPPRGVLVHVSPCFAVSRRWETVVFRANAQEIAHVGRVWAKKVPLHVEILAAATPSPRFQHVSPCCGVGKNSYFRPILPKIAHVGATFCPETQNRPAIRKPPSGIFARKHVISSQKFPAVKGKKV